MSYLEQAIDNLNGLKSIAHLNARLALVGISAELEALVHDLLKPAVSRFGDRIAAEDPGNFNPETTAARRMLRGLVRHDAIEARMRSTLESILGRADEARHCRIKVAISEAHEAIDSVVAFLIALQDNDVMVHGIGHCDQCDRDLDGSIRHLLSRSPGDEVRLTCVDHATEVYQHTLGSPTNTKLDVRWPDTDEVAGNGRALLDCAADALVEGTIDLGEYSLLKTLVLAAACREASSRPNAGS